MTFKDLRLGVALKEVLDQFSQFGLNIVVGTVGFELHGALPNGYETGDVDVYVYADTDNYDRCNKILYQKYNEFRKKSRSLRDLAGISLTNKCFIFYTSQEVKANIWLRPKSEIPSRIVTMLVEGREVNTLPLNELYRHKINLNRQKDLVFTIQYIKTILSKKL